MFENNFIVKVTLSKAKNPTNIDFIINEDKGRTLDKVVSYNLKDIGSLDLMLSDFSTKYKELKKTHIDYSYQDIYNIDPNLQFFMAMLLARGYLTAVDLT